VLPIDVSRPARSYSERLALVKAVAGAPPSEPETDWLEWKSQLDVSSKAGAYAAARSVLGFGNRDPDHARRFAKGCAYLLAGVEPGNLAGVAVHDPADVEQWLNRFIAPGRPQWDVDYVDVGGKAVLFLTVEAPEWGDAPFTLQRALDGYHAGAVYVRTRGKTDYATPADIERLTERAKRGDTSLNLELGLRKADASLQAVRLTSEMIDAWRTQEAARLKRRGAANLVASSFIAGGDLRDGEEYDAEVERYLAKAARRLRLLAMRGVIEQDLAPLELRLTNPLEINFASVQVRVTLPGDVLAYFDDSDIEVDLSNLEPPFPWGRSMLGLPRVAPVEPIDFFQTGARIDTEDGAVVVTLPPVDVRPGSVHELSPVHLLVPASYAGKSISFTWRATSKSAAGAVSGTGEIAVGAVPVDAFEVIVGDD
jgi:hypothetical protein